MQLALISLSYLVSAKCIDEYIRLRVKEYDGKDKKHQEEVRG